MDLQGQLMVEVYTLLLGISTPPIQKGPHAYKPSQCDLPGLRKEPGLMEINCLKCLPDCTLCFKFEVFFWAPTFKWGISIANIADLQRPPEKISMPQQSGERI